MAKRFTDTEKFKKRWIKDLSMEYKLFWVYLLDHCNHAGIWDVEMDIANVRLGTDLKEEETLKAFSGKIISLDNGNKWFIPKFVTFQYSELNENVKAHKSVIDILKSLSVYKQFVKSSGTVLDMDKDKDMDMELVKSIVSDLNLVLGSSYKHTTQTIKDFIKARLNEGFSLDDFKTVHRKMLTAWGADEKMYKYLRPQTLYSNKFESYLNYREMTTKLTESGVKAYLVGQKWLENKRKQENA